MAKAGTGAIEEKATKAAASAKRDENPVEKAGQAIRRQIPEPTVTVKIDELKQEYMQVRLVGLTQLVINKFSKKHQAESFASGRGSRGGTKKVVGGSSPAEMFEDVKYRDPVTGQEGLPAHSITKAMMYAAYLHTRLGATINGTFEVFPDFTDEDGSECVYIDSRRPSSISYRSGVEA